MHRIFISLTSWLRVRRARRGAAGPATFRDWADLPAYHPPREQDPAHR